MKIILILIFCFSTLLFLGGCVSTPENADVTSAAPVKGEEVSVPDEEESSVDNQVRKHGIIYAGRELSDGPLLLGSKEHLTGPVAEFSILFSIYFPLSGILKEDHQYDIASGTRWQVESAELMETVYFERALLNEDDEGKSWWYFKVEGSGFEREFEFLLDPDWKLIEMRYRHGDLVKSYFPSVEEGNDLSGGALPYSEYKVGRESIETESGSFSADHITTESSEHWMSSRVTGHFVRTVQMDGEEIILTATLVEEKEDYRTVYESY